MSVKDDKGRWIDAAGNHVPQKYIDPIDKKRDAIVEKLFRRALKVQEQLEKFKELVDTDVEKYLDWMVDHVAGKTRNKSNNYELPTFYGDKQILVKTNKVTEFDERLQVAKDIIDSCIEKWSAGANDKLKIIIFDAFKVDKKGNVDRDRILSLRRLNIKDKEWQKAMDLISDSLRQKGTRTYFLFQVRENKGDRWKTIRLDLAGV